MPRRVQPPFLKKALVRNHLWQAGFALDTTQARRRGDVFHASGSFLQCVASLVQALHALNERYLVNEKGALRAAEGLPVRPEGFVGTASLVFSRPGHNPNRLRRSQKIWNTSSGKRGH